MTGQCTKASDHASLNHCNGLLVVRRHARSVAVVKRPRARLLDRVWGFLPGAPAPVDPAEVAAFQQAARELFHDNQRLAESPRPASIDTPPSPAPDHHTHDLVPNSPAPSEPHIQSIMPLPESAVSSRESAVEERPRVRSSHLSAESAPDSLLKAPTNVAPVADDFFAGLIRRVEGGDR